MTLLRLVNKELLQHLLHFRFITILVLSALIGILSTYVGTRDYLRQKAQYDLVSEANKSFLKASLAKTGHEFLKWDLGKRGFPWNKPPEILSPIVFGLSGVLGREAHIQYRRLNLITDSLFAVDPTHALFGVLDFSLIVEMILSLCVVLLTYDTVCGEKQSGTLRLYMSFPVSRVTFAVAKLIGSTTAVLVPCLCVFLLTSALISFIPEMQLSSEDWIRMLILMVVFTLYLIVFSAFGLFISALTESRMTAFLGILSLWVIWLFVWPNFSVFLSGRLAPVESIYSIQAESQKFRWQVKELRQKELQELHIRYRNRGKMSEEEWRRRLVEEMHIEDKWDRIFYHRVRELRNRRLNQLHRRHALGNVLAMISPTSALSLMSMDFARTGLVQQEQLEDALNKYLIYLANYIHAKRGQPESEWQFDNFVWFTYRSQEPLADCLNRNWIRMLNLVALAALGFVGAYVAILRYDVR